MKKWILISMLLLLFGGLGFSCSGNSSPTSSNGTPMPGHGGY